MKLLLTATAGLFAASTLLGQQPGSTPTPSPASQAGTTAVEAPPMPTPTPSLVDNLIKLWKANLSEDFLKKYISGADIAKDLSAEDIVKLRNAGLPESLISAVSERKQVVATPTAVPATRGLSTPRSDPHPGDCPCGGKGSRAATAASSCSRAGGIPASSSSRTRRCAGRTPATRRRTSS